MKDINGNDIQGPTFRDAHGQKVDHKGSLLERVASEVKHGVEKAAEEVVHVADAPFQKHEVPAGKPAEPAKTAPPAKAAEPAEVKKPEAPKAE